MKRQNGIWYIKVEGMWLLLEDYPLRQFIPCVIRAILYKGASLVC